MYCVGMSPSSSSAVRRPTRMQISPAAAAAAAAATTTSDFALTGAIIGEGLTGLMFLSHSLMSILDGYKEFVLLVWVNASVVRCLFVCLFANVGVNKGSGFARPTGSHSTRCK
jgi:uncharacterized membrane protein